jgi:hypothetical protein
MLNLSLGELINSVIAIGTLGAAIAAWRAAQTSAKQVRFQFEPKLRIPDRRFQIKVHKDILKEIWWSPPTDEVRIVNGGSTDYSFGIENIGAGAATDISVSTKYDYSTIFSSAQEKLGKNAPNLEILMDHWGVIIKEQGHVVGGFQLPDGCVTQIDFLPPAGKEASSGQVLIDPSLAFFLLVYAHGILFSEHKNQRVEVAIVFEVSFSDQSGTARKQEFNASLEISGGRSKSDLTDGVALIYLKSRDR